MRMYRLIGLIVISLLTTICGAQVQNQGEVFKYLVIAEHRIVNQWLSTAVYCTEPRADCNTTYMSEVIYIPFSTIEAALDYLNGKSVPINIGIVSGTLSPEVLRNPRIVELKEVPIKIDEKRESIPQPPIVKTHTSYSEIK